MRHVLFLALFASGITANHTLKINTLIANINAAIHSPSQSFLSPHFHSEFILSHLIGAGYNGAVYHAHTLLTHIPVAIKFQYAPKLPACTLLREVRILTLIRADPRSRAVSLGYIGCGIEADSLVYIVTESILNQFGGASSDLRAYTLSQFHPESALSTIHQLLKQLTSLHRLGIYHQDLKQDNVVISSTHTVYLIDFGNSGIAFDHTLTSLEWNMTFQTSQFSGTPLYGSPQALTVLAYQQLIKESNWNTRSFTDMEDELKPTYDVFKNDVYSLGMMYLELIVGITAILHEDTIQDFVELNQNVFEEIGSGVYGLLLGMLGSAEDTRWTANESLQAVEAILTDQSRRGKGVTSGASRVGVDVAGFLSAIGAPFSNAFRMLQKRLTGLVYDAEDASGIIEFVQGVVEVIGAKIDKLLAVNDTEPDLSHSGDKVEDTQTHETRDMWRNLLLGHLYLNVGGEFVEMIERIHDDQFDVAHIPRSVIEFVKEAHNFLCERWMESKLHLESQSSDSNITVDGYQYADQGARRIELIRLQKRVLLHELVLFTSIRMCALNDIKDIYSARTFIREALNKW